MTRYSHAEWHEAGDPQIDAISDTIHVYRCGDSGIECEGSGTGTFDYESPEASYHCHCDDTYFCGGPAFGFYGLNGLTFSYECSSTPINDPACGSGIILSCEFGQCEETAHTVYSEPCIPT